MTTIIRAAFAIPWMIALFGTLQIHQLNLHMGHSICGAWGCGPPTEALIGYHTFWLVLLVPMGRILSWVLPDALRRRMGFALLAMSVAAAVGYIAWDGYGFYQTSRSVQLIGQRALFALATAVDLPIIQTGLAGLALMWGTSRVSSDSIHAKQARAPQSP